MVPLFVNVPIEPEFDITPYVGAVEDRLPLLVRVAMVPELPIAPVFP